MQEPAFGWNFLDESSPEPRLRPGPSATMPHDGSGIFGQATSGTVDGNDKMQLTITKQPGLHAEWCAYRDTSDPTVVEMIAKHLEFEISLIMHASFG